MAKMPKEILNPIRNVYGVKPVYGHTLRIQNTGRIFYCSHEDWKVARHCHWFLSEDGMLRNKAGLTFQEYVGIHGKRNKRSYDEFDYSREVFK